MKKYILLLFCVLLWIPFSVKAANPVKEQYEEFEKRFDSIEIYDDISKNSFKIIDNQVFTESLKALVKNLLLLCLH